MKIKTVLAKFRHGVQKNSPEILTGVGIVGLGATAYLSYKAHGKVEAIVSEVEKEREAGNDVDKAIVVRDVVAAVALPTITGVVSVGAILGSYKIQRNRIGVLAGALATSATEQLYYREKYKKEHGEEAYEEFYTPMEEKEVTKTDEDGEETKVVEKVKTDVGNMNGEWFDKSDEYTSDDHVYNKTYVANVIERLELIYFQRGFLLMNEVLQEFGFEPTRAGALLGWSQSTVDPAFEAITHNLYNEETGFREPQIRIKWNAPTYTYSDLDYSEALDKWR